MRLTRCTLTAARRPFLAAIEELVAKRADVPSSKSNTNSGGGEWSYTCPSSSGNSSNDDPWLDDVLPKERAIEAHRESALYRELHRPHMTNMDMGLFGGERGFEISPRVWVDPDNPLTKKPLFNRSHLAKNLRYARYGYFKGDLQIIDMDKLVRHARMVPSAFELLSDVVSNRAALDDHGCAALLLQSFRRMLDRSPEARQDYFRMHVEQVFERMLMTTVPPLQVGIETHAAAIRCCAVAGRFEEGYNGYRARAIEEADAWTDRLLSNGNHSTVDDETTASNAFLLNADFFDAVVLLCVSTGHFEEALLELERAIRYGRRLLTATLDNALFACAYLRRGEDAHEVWQLYPFYRRAPTAVSFEQLAACVGRCSTDTPVLANRMVGFLSDARQALGDGPTVKRDHITDDDLAQRVTIKTVAWIFHAFSACESVGHHQGDSVLSELQTLTSTGAPPTDETILFALQYCAARSEDGGETALKITTDVLPRLGINPTFEMVLLATRAFAGSLRPTPTMLQVALELEEKMKHTTGVAAAGRVRFAVPDDIAEYRRQHQYPLNLKEEQDVFGEGQRENAEMALCVALMTLCARIGASADAFKLLSREVMECAEHAESEKGYRLRSDGLPPVLFSLALTACAAAHSGPMASHDVTLEIMQLWESVSTGEISVELIRSLCECRKAHGPFTDALAAALDGSGIVEGGIEASLLDLVDASDGYLELYRDEQPDEVARITAILGELKSESQHRATLLATQPWKLDLFSCRRSKAEIRIGAKQICLNSYGQCRNHPKKIRAANVLKRWTSFGEHSRTYQPIE